MIGKQISCFNCNNRYNDECSLSREKERACVLSKFKLHYSYYKDNAFYNYKNEVIKKIVYIAEVKSEQFFVNMKGYLCQKIDEKSYVTLTDKYGKEHYQHIEHPGSYETIRIIF